MNPKKSKQSKSGRPSADKLVLFVCTGNTCRSPMAEALFNQLSAHAGCRAASAGLAAVAGQQASTQVIDVMQRLFGLDMSGHRARLVTGDVIQEADLILTMTGEQKNLLIQAFPQQADKIRTLAEASGLANQDVSDPYGSQVWQYEQTAQQLTALMRDLVDQMCAKDDCSPKTDCR